MVKITFRLSIHEITRGTNALNKRINQQPRPLLFNLFNDLPRNVLQKISKKKSKKKNFGIFEKLLKSRLGHVASFLPSPLLQIEKTNRISAIFYSCSKRKGRRGLFCLSPLLFAEAVLSRIVLPLLIILSPTVKIYYSNYGFY